MKDRENSAGAKFYTVMVIPHQGSRMRSFAISKPFVLTMGGLLVALALAGIFFPHNYLAARRQEKSLLSLRLHNDTLSRTLHEVDTQVALLRGQIEHYEHEARKFALMAGLDGLPDEMQASGGAVPHGEPILVSGNSVHEDLRGLMGRERRLTKYFETLAVAYEKREAYLATIPSSTPVTEGYFGSSFGYRRDPFTGARVFHRGQDIVARAGTPVLAPASGRVSVAGRMGGLGNAVYLSHSKDVVSRFGHMSRLNVKRGQKVERGDVIGFVGSTGRSMGTHLHYEVIVSGKPVDPRNFILEEPTPPLG